jgi:predicted DNA-binding transcriptional regulator YafY
MRADRLLSILLLLQARGQTTGRELAKHLEVSERTVHRDMDALSAAGVPVFALRGAQGGWQLDEGWRTQVPGLDEAELRAFLMVQPRVIGDKRLAAAAERALSKLMAALPVSLREQAASIRQRLYVDPTGWHGANEDLSMLPMVQHAVARDRKLKIRYRKPEEDGPTVNERVVDPLGLVAKGSSWYLVANTARGYRTYRVSRIENVTLLDKPCDRPANFDLAAHWQQSTQQFMDGRPRYPTILSLAPTAASEVKKWRPTSPVEDAEEPDGKGWALLNVRFDTEEEAVFVILGFGARAEVIKPESLRKRIAAELSNVMERMKKRA